jgi:hypothetical protein
LFRDKDTLLDTQKLDCARAYPCQGRAALDLELRRAAKRRGACPRCWYRMNSSWQASFTRLGHGPDAYDSRCAFAGQTTGSSQFGRSALHRPAGRCR